MKKNSKNGRQMMKKICSKYFYVIAVLLFIGGTGCSGNNNSTSQTEEVSTDEIVTDTVTDEDNGDVEQKEESTTEDVQKQVFMYEQADGGVIITGVFESEHTDIYIPAEIGGYSVVGIQDNAFMDLKVSNSIVVDEKLSGFTSRDSNGKECNVLISVEDGRLLKGCGKSTIPENVKRISFMAFNCTEGLTEVVIPDSVTEIDSKAFFNCSELKSVVFPNTELDLDVRAFADCHGIEELTLSSFVFDIWKDCFVKENIKKMTILDGITSMEERTFSGMQSLEYITLPSDLVKINTKAFENCISLKEIVIPKGVMLIDGDAFKNCPSIESIIVDEENMFYTSKGEDGKECNAIIDVQYKMIVRGCVNTVLSSNVTQIGAYAFSGMNAEKFSIPDYVILMGEKAFCDAEITTLTMPGEILTRECLSDSKVKNIIVTEGVTSIPQYAFAFNDNLESVVLPDGVVEISGYAFERCRNLKSVIMPEGLEIIGKYAFYQCSSLENFELPKSLTTIGDWSVRECTSLKKINIPERVTYIGHCAFYEDENLEGTITIPGGVGKLESTFGGCENISKVIINQGVKELDYGAFGDCIGLESVVIPASITEINRNAFENCTNLTVVYAPSGSYAADWAQNNGYRVLEP